MDREKTDWQNTESLRKIVQSGDIYELWQRLIFVSQWLEEAGLSPEAIMLGYFNECMRVATESRGLKGSYILANQLHWHVVQLIRNLHTASEGVRLEEIPADPTVKKPDPEQQ